MADNVQRKKDLEVAIKTLNAAIQELTQGKRLTTLTIGSGDFQRTYEFQKINYETLRADLSKLQHELDTLTATDDITFRQSGHVPLVVSKLP